MIPASIQEKIGLNLFKNSNHPIGIIKEKIYQSFPNFYRNETLPVLVNLDQNFNSLRIPDSHPSRKTSDTFYQDGETVLRTHMTAHLTDLIKAGRSNYLICGDVYRKDAIDRTHYPIFHQMDGFAFSTDPELDLRESLSVLIKNLFGHQVKFRFLEDKVRNDIYFPFTINSCEVEVEILDAEGNNTWVEILGGGTVHPEIMEACGFKNRKGWAFGLGLERLAMKLFSIPDIRLFWSTDERFLSQFKAGQINTFTPYSKYPPCYKDLSFWLPENFEENELNLIIRENGQDLIEEVKLIDKFVHPKTQKISHCYRINYRGTSKTLLNSEIDQIQNLIRQDLTNKLQIELR